MTTETDKIIEKKCENCSAYGHCDEGGIVPNGKKGFCSKWKKGFWKD